MDKSRSWIKTSKLIIDHPAAQPPLHRAAFGLVTLAIWLLWLYLLMPAVTLLAWAFGALRFVDVMVVQSGASSVFRLLGWYLLIVVILSGSLIGWALYNWIRFRNSDRRGARRGVQEHQAIADHLGVDARLLAGWQLARWVRVQFDRDGRIAEIDTWIPQPDASELSRPPQTLPPRDAAPATPGTG